MWCNESSQLSVLIEMLLNRLDVLLCKFTDEYLQYCCHQLIYSYVSFVNMFAKIDKIRQIGFSVRDLNNTMFSPKAYLS